ncbi:MAG: DUF1801 domain-containing protein [Aureispira sp.]|nr:DUF1801 domain-containing protein [Aureispira sp.]
MKIKADPRVKSVFDNYPDHIRPKLMNLKELVLEAAKEVEGIKQLEVTLKWGEPSFLAKKGSTVRIDWKKKTPDQYAIYFKCTSKLVPTFKTLYADTFTFENNRAILFKLNDKIPTQQLKHCITLALTYHNVKHLPNLGAEQKDEG